MAKTSKIDISREKKEKLSDTDEKIKDTDKEVKEGEKTKDVFDSQPDMILEETAREINSQGEKLGKTIIDETEKPARETDNFIQITTQFEDVLYQHESHEKSAYEQIASAASNIDNPSLTSEIKDVAQQRREASDFLKSEKNDTNKERLKDEEEVKQLRANAQQIASSIRQF